MLGQALLALGLVGARTDGADVEGLGAERLHQRQVVELGVVRERDDGGVAVRAQFAHGVVGHAGHQTRLLCREAGGVLLARVAHQHLVAQRGGHGRQVLRELAGADQQQAPARAVVGDEVGGAELELVSGVAGLELDSTAGEFQAPAHALAALQALEQLAQAGARLHRLEHELDQPAAGQAEAVRGVGVDAVAHHLRPAGGERARLGLVDQVVLDAAAGDAAGHQAVVADGHRRAGRARRRAPGAGDGAQRHAVPGIAPGRDLAQDLQVDVVHDAQA